MALLDIVFLVLSILIIIHCGVRGFCTELTSTASFVLGAIFAYIFYGAGAAFIRLRWRIQTEYLAEILSFIALFLIAYIAVKIVGSILKGIIEGLSLGFIDKVLGLVFGFFKSFAIIAILVFIIRIQPLTDGNKLLQGTITGRIFSSIRIADDTLYYNIENIGSGVDV